MRTFVAAVFMSLACCGQLIPAPAPLARRAEKREPEHPSGLVRTWTLTWFGAYYKYEFHPDGSYTHVRQYGWETDYSGYWRVENGTLYVTEMDQGRQVLKHSLVPSDKGWTCRERTQTHLSDRPVRD